MATSSSMVKSSTIQQSSGKRLINSIFGTYSTKIKNDSSKDIYVVLSESEVTVVATRNIQASVGNSIASASTGLQVQSTYQGAKKQETIIPSNDDKEFDIDHDYYLTLMTLSNGVWMIHERNRYIPETQEFHNYRKEDTIYNRYASIYDTVKFDQTSEYHIPTPMTRSVGVNTDPE